MAELADCLTVVPSQSMSGIKAHKSHAGGGKITPSKRADKLSKARYVIAPHDVLSEVLGKLSTCVEFGVKVGVHVVVGFNCVMRAVERGHTDTVVLSADAPASAMQAMYEAIAVRQRSEVQHKHSVASSSSSSSSSSSKNGSSTSSSTASRSPIALLVLPAKSSRKLAALLRLRHASCFALPRSGGSSAPGSADEAGPAAEQHAAATLDALREVVLRHAEATFSAAKL